MKMLRIGAVWTLCGLALLACAAQTPATPGAPLVTPQPALEALPASFEGVLPCADCEGIRYRLNLFPGQVFFLAASYLGRADARYDDIGRWELTEGGKALVLRGGREAPLTFGIADARTLRKRDMAGREIVSSLNYSLTRTERFERIVPRLAMRGMYRYMADAASFTECLTGERWPVMTEADNLRLERAYLAARREAGEPLLVSVEGRVELRPPMEGDVQVPSLVVERFVAVWPGQDCASAADATRSAAPLSPPRAGASATSR